MKPRRRMHLVAFLLAGPTAHHHGAWRHPEADLGVFTPQWHEHIARVLEQGKFDSLFFADILGLYDLFGGSFATILRCGGQMGLLDPIPLLSIMSRVTSRIVLGATLSSTFYPPYHLARTLGTLDLLSGGRVAWNVVASHGHLEAQNFGRDLLPARDSRYDYADEVVEAVCRLWESWDADALVLDKQRGIYADPDKVHYVNYQGRWINTRGPLTVPRSPQGRPVIMQAGSSPRGRDFAARWGELVFTLQHSKSDMQAFYQDLKARVVAQGRAPDECLILPSVDAIIGETDAIARERQAYVNDLVQTEVGMAQMSGHSSSLDIQCAEMWGNIGPLGILD
jgi:FMN-dependent oxidoreductase (nitrilotriacetate monooxygenase family)